MRSQFDTIEYLQAGNPKQRLAYDILKQSPLSPKRSAWRETLISLCCGYKPKTRQRAAPTLNAPTAAGNVKLIIAS